MFKINDKLFEEDPGAADPTPAAPAAPSPAAPNFIDSIDDATVKTWAQGKGWKDPSMMAKSAYNLEKMMGAPADQLLRLPRSDDPEGFRQAMGRLGRPAEAKDYAIDPEGVEGFDPGFADAARSAFLDADLAKPQAEKLVSWWNTRNAEMVKQAADNYKLSVETGEKDLKKEWGNGYEKQFSIAEKAVKDLGFTEEMIDALDLRIGYAPTIRFLNGLGRKLGEDSFVSGKSGSFNPESMTPIEARQVWADMLQDPNMVKAMTDSMHPGHKAALEKKSKIFKVIYPDND